MPPPPPVYLFGSHAWWQNLFTGVWVAGIIITGAYLLLSLLQIRKVASGNTPGGACQAKAHAVWAGSALGGLIGFGAVLLAVAALFS